MSTLQTLAAQPGVARLGGTLLHFLWQGLAIALLYAAVRRAARDSAPNTRYLLACAALAAMAIAPLTTWWLLGAAAPQSAGALPAASHAFAAVGAIRNLTASFTGVASPAAQSPLLSWVVALWLAGATAFWIRLTGGWILACRLRSHLAGIAPAIWQQTLDHLKPLMRVTAPVRLRLSSMVPAPAVVGWIRPLVLVPAGALAGLPAEYLEALLLHELAHIRRCDYLVNMLQSAVEALLFYHPAVWWVSGHMRAERELCCDDAAVAATGDATLYARALAGLGLLCPPVVMAANGGPLAYRIARLLGQQRPVPRATAGTGMLAALLPLLAAAALVAQPAPRLSFQVASIKPAEESGPMRMRPTPDGLQATASLRTLIQMAYKVQSFQVPGGPGWLDTERYTVNAKADGRATRDQISLMLQSLLADRCQLKVHRETRELPVFDLTVAKGGAKLPPPGVVACQDTALAPAEVNGGRMGLPGTVPALAPCGRLNVTLQPGGVLMSGGKIAMPELLRIVSALLSRTVIDHTGLTGTFDVHMQFQADENTPVLPAPPPEAPPSDTAGPTIFTAMAQQLGLRLESAKGPVDVVIVDRVERPTAN